MWCVVASVAASAEAVGHSSFDASSVDPKRYMSHYAADYERYMPGVNPLGSGGDSYERYMASASTDNPPNTMGCCYSVGFGARMVPVDLTTASLTRSACLDEQTQRDGGITGWSQPCPQDAAEAARWAQAAAPPPNLIALPANSTLCAAHPECVHLKLTGHCCPTGQGSVLDCCSDVPAPAPAPKPDSSACSAHRKCRGHDGDCCPTDEGVQLDCCSSSVDLFGDFEDLSEQEQTVQESSATLASDEVQALKQADVEVIEVSTHPAVSTVPVALAFASLAIFTSSLVVALGRRGTVQNEGAREPFLMVA